MSPKTYTFFEPRNNDFFKTLVDHYRKLIENNFDDSTKTFSIREATGQDQFDFVDKFFRNYYENLSFPACNYNEGLTCNRTKCVPERLVVLTSTQVSMIAECVDKALDTLEKRPGISTSNAIINKIRNRCPWLDKADKTILKKDPQSDRYLAYYAAGIKRKIQNGTKKIVYVRAENDSDFNEIRKKIKPNTVIPCDEYQNLS
jgi:hypothetical protein